MTWLDFLKDKELTLKQNGVKLTSKNKQKLKDAWLRKEPITFGRMFEVEYSEKIVEAARHSLIFGYSIIKISDRGIENVVSLSG